jgi:integrase
MSSFPIAYGAINIEYLTQTGVLFGEPSRHRIPVVHQWHERMAHRYWVEEVSGRPGQRCLLRANGLQWKGWHAYRRGLATNLKRLGIPDTVIQAILRHTDVGTTQLFYIKTVRADVRDAMRQLEQEINRAAVVQQPERSALVN